MRQYKITYLTRDNKVAVFRTSEETFEKVLWAIEKCGYRLLGTQEI